MVAKKDIAQDCNLVQGVVLLGEMDEDRQGTSFIWGRLLSQNPLNDAGEAVKNPGSIMIYSPRGLRTGAIQNVTLIKRGLGGLYDFIKPEDEAIALTAMGLSKEQLPEITVVEAKPSNKLSRDEARERASKARMRRRQREEIEVIGLGETTSTPIEEEIL